MRSRSLLLKCLAAFAIVFAAQIASASQQHAQVETARAQLSQRLLRHARIALAEQQPTTESLEIATILVDEALKLTPSSEEAWRMALQLAELAEDPQAQDRALSVLVQLAPEDEVVRLKRANQRIEQLQTAESRIAEFEALLARENRDRLGPAVASRLALDLALLQRRAGSASAFAHWLAEAVALDSSHRAAAALASGYFRANVRDAFAEGELLVSLLMADPVQVPSQIALASHLMEHGAYAGAQRFYALAVKTNEAAMVRSSAELIADLAIAQWGSGDREAALRTVRDFQRLADLLHRRQLQTEQPGLTSLELAREVAVIDPTIAVIRTALYRRIGSELASPSLASAVGAYEQLLQSTGEQQLDPPAAARVKLELAWVLLWLGESESQRVRDLLAEAEQHEVLTDAARARFDGWLALRQNDLDSAIGLLQPHIETDAAAMLGYATALLAQGHRRDAARQLVTLARQQAGTVIGVWATDVLWEVLGQRAEIGTSAAKQLEQLIEAIPSVLDRFPQDPSTAFSIRVSPAKDTFQPYEPLIVNVEITNHAPFPLAISGDGPIRSQIVLQVSAEMVRASRAEQVPPLVVDIDRRLRLMPRERLVIPVNLRSTLMGHMLDRSPLPGAIMRVNVVSNFLVTPQGAILPGLLGLERETPRFRVDGFRVTAEWIEQTMAGLVDHRTEIDLARLACLCHLAANPDVAQTDELRRLFADARTLLGEVYAQLDAETQAWMLSVLPQTDVFAPIRAQARQSQRRLVQLSYLLHQVRRRDDPMLAAAARSGDPGLQRLAELMEPRLQATQEPTFGQSLGR